jgi:hypothetical protein
VEARPVPAFVALRYAVEEAMAGGPPAQICGRTPPPPPAGEPYASEVLSRYWRETLQAAGIRHVKLHAAWIGHKDALLTMKLAAARLRIES